MPEEDQARGLNILCMDAGGVRGLSSLVLLGEIMGRVGELEGRYERPDPAEYFDVIAGSGTGGIGACMLGRLHMSLSQAISAHAKLVTAVFTSDKKTRGTHAASACQAARLEGALKSIVRSATGKENEQMKGQPDRNSPKTIVFAMSRQNLDASIPVLFRSYESARTAAPDCAIWEALYATAAHPDLFRSIDICDGPIPLSFVGGEVGCSNPIAHVLAEVSTLYPHRYVSCVLSIGAGHARTISLPDPSQPQRLLNIQEATAMKDMAMDSEREAEVMAARFKHTSGLYYRFNVDQGVQDINADDWEKLGAVVAHTRAYIGKVEPGRGIDQAAKSIMERKAVISAKQLDGSVQFPSIALVARIKHCPAPSSMFTGREDTIRQVSTCIVDPNHERRACVIYGLGGAGKTQLALKTIERYLDHWSHVLFVDASSKETVESELQDIAKAKDAGKTYDDTLRWLATCRETWLLVFDNADDPSLGIHDYLPSGNRGSILITTRLSGMRIHGRGPSSDCHISQMSLEDSLALLLRLAGVQGEVVTENEMEAATALLEDLGHFALAIVQAGSYIAHSSMSISEYRQLFLARRRSTLEQYRKLKVKVDNYQWSVFTTWKLCYDRLDESDNSRPLLWLLAFTHHDQITANMFERAAANINANRTVLLASAPELTAREYVQEYLSRFLDEDGRWDALLFSNAISELVSHSLLEYHRSNATYSIHVLVQEWVRTVVPQPTVLALECTTTLLAHAVDHGNSTEAHRSRLSLALHVIKVLSEQQDTISANHARSFARVYSTQGLWDRQQALELRGKEAMEQELGAEHPATLKSMSNLASTYWNLGRWDEAEQLMVKVLNTYRRTLGEEHRATLISMGNLASTYWGQGRWNEAEQLEVKVLDAHIQRLGEEHPDTLRSMSNLASTFQYQGLWNKAERLQVKVLDAHRRTLGAEHPDTLASVGNLAATCRDKGQWDEAEQLEVEALDTCRRTLGKEHPTTLISMQGLAATYWKQGRWDKAEQLVAEVANSHRQSLGNVHPNTMSSMSLLASTYWTQGRWDEAEQLELKVLDTRKQTLGVDHPDTLASMHSLASTYRDKGRWDEAEQLQVKVLDTRRKAFGGEHPDTLKSMNSLGLTYQSKGQWDAAEQLHANALDAQRRTLGEEHPDTLASLHNLSIAYAGLGRWEKAERMLSQVVDARTRKIGDQHPQTLQSRELLSSVKKRRPPGN